LKECPRTLREEAKRNDFLDVAKALDTVRVERLYKLTVLNSPPNPVKIIVSYLNG
jgi:hypothetical protein